MNMKRWLSLCLCALMLAGALTLAACKKSTPSGESEGSQGLTYELNGSRNAYIVTGMGTCTDTRVVIPATYNGLPVAEIAEGAFRAAESPKAPEVSGGDKDQDKDKEKDDKLSLGGFGWLSALLPLEDAAEQPKPEAAITEVVIPDSVVNVGEEAFYGCENLARFETSNLINLIGTDAFKNTAFYLDESNWQDGVLYLEEYLVEVRPTVTGDFIVREGTVNVASSAFLNCTGITSVTFPDTMRFVGNMAFMGCSAITEIDLSFPGIQIGNQAFLNCTALTSVKIATNDTPNAPPVVSYIGAGVMGKDEVYMPGGFIDFAFDPKADPNLIYSAYIGYEAFRGCTALTTVTLGSNVGDIGADAFHGCTSLVSVDLSMLTAAHPDTAVVTPSSNRHWHSALENVFAYCTSLKEVKLPQNIMYLRHTFIGCTALESFTVPATVKGLWGTFEGCTALTSVTLPEGLEALSRTFSRCEALESVNVPSTVVKIGDGTFYGCSKLYTVDIPASVTVIGRYPFASMDVLTYQGTLADWAKIELDARWSEGNEIGRLFVACADGMLLGDEILPAEMSPMAGILLADGTVYVRFLDIGMQYLPDGSEQRITETLAEIEAKLVADGATGWRTLTMGEIRGLENDIYDRIFAQVSKEFWEGGGTVNKPNTDQPTGGGTASTEEMKGILLADGTLYAERLGVTVTVVNGQVTVAKIPYSQLEKDLQESGEKDWVYLNDKQIAEQFGEDIYSEIFSLTKVYTKQ